MREMLMQTVLMKRLSSVRWRGCVPLQRWRCRAGCPMLMMSGPPHGPPICAVDCTACDQRR